MTASCRKNKQSAPPQKQEILMFMSVMEMKGSNFQLTGNEEPIFSLSVLKKKSSICDC